MRVEGPSLGNLAFRTLSHTDTQGVPPVGRELGTFTKNHPGNAGQEAREGSFALEGPPGNNVEATQKGASGKR